MTVRKLAGTLLILSATALILPVGLLAQAGAWDPDRPDSHAPIGLNLDRTLLKGQVEFGAKFIQEQMKGVGFGKDSLTLQSVLNDYYATPTKMITQGAELTLMVGVTDWVTLAATGNFVQKKMTQGVLDADNPSTYWLGDTKSMGPEDVQVSALVKVLDHTGVRLHVNGGVSIPIGTLDYDDNALDPEEPLGDPVEVILPYQQQLGSGTFDLLPGFTASIQNEKASLGLQWHGAIRMGKNDQKWALGNRYEGTVWAGYRASDWASVAIGGRYSTWDNIKGFERGVDLTESLAYSSPVYERGQAGSRVDIPLALNFIFPDGPLAGHRLAFEFLAPVHQDLEFIQMRHDWTLTVGWRKAFGF